RPRRAAPPPPRALPPAPGRARTDVTGRRAHPRRPASSTPRLAPRRGRRSPGPVATRCRSRHPRAPRRPGRRRPRCPRSSSRAPPEPAVRPARAAPAVVEVRGCLACLLALCRLLQRALAVVGVHVLDHLAPEQILVRPAEHLAPGGVDLLELALARESAHEVE